MWKNEVSQIIVAISMYCQAKLTFIGEPWPSIGELNFDYAIEVSWAAAWKQVLNLKNDEESI